MMSINTTFKSRIAIHIPDSTEDLKTIIIYISENIDLWKDKNTLWDVRALNFKEISSEALKSFTEKIQSVTRIREGLKTAFVVDSDLAFGMMRMLQLLYTEKTHIIVEIFKDRNEALKWLSE
jgi:hypothetical protein